MRFKIGVDLWHDVMPRFFANNTMAAKATFACGVMQLNAHRLWKGEHGGQRGVPFPWLYSAEHNTGKTSAAKLVHALTGQGAMELWGGVTTEPMIFERAAAQSCMPLIIDDIVIKDAKEHASKKFADVGRMLFGRSERAVTGCQRLPHSQCIFSANTTVNDNDAAFLSRTVLLHFQPLRATDDGGSDRYSSMLELLPALLGDFSSILWQGALDDEAIKDVERFLNRCVDRVRDRNTGAWALVLYYLICVNFMLQGNAQDYDDAICYVTQQMASTNYEVMHHAGKLDQLVLAIEHVRNEAQPNPLGSVERTIYWHNFRTTATPTGIAATAGEFYAIRLESVCNVIETVTKQIIKPADVQAAAQHTDWAITGDRASFYDPTTSPWPIATIHSQFETGTCQNVPLPEDRLVKGTLKRSRCLFLKKSEYDRIVRSVQQPTALKNDPRTLTIESKNKSFNGGKPYNFYEAVTGSARDRTPEWFGFRFGRYSTFRDFVHGNRAFVGSPLHELQLSDELVKHQRDMLFPPIEECYEPDRIRKYYRYEPHLALDLPPCFEWDPFVYLNDATCDYRLPRRRFVETSDAMTESDARTADESSPGLKRKYEASVEQSQNCCVSQVSDDFLSEDEAVEREFYEREQCVDASRACLVRCEAVGWDEDGNPAECTGWRNPEEPQCRRCRVWGV